MIVTDIGPGLDALDLDAGIRTELRRQGVVTCAQLFDILRGPAGEDLFRRIIGSDETERAAWLGKIGSRLPAEQVRAQASCDYRLPSLSGLAGPSEDSAIIRRRRAVTARDRKALVKRVREIREAGDLPTRSLLTDYGTPVRDQGSLGSCTGWGSTANREMLVQLMLSPLFAYLMAKQLDGHPELEGSWQHFCFEAFSRFGQLREIDFPYTDRPGDFDRERYREVAAEFRIDGYVDLLPDPEDIALLPTLMKAILAGRLTGELGPQGMSVSVPVGSSWEESTTFLYGLVRLEPDKFVPRGGHAMYVEGYIDGDDPDGLYDTDYFVVKNSWGTGWARENLLGLPGYALFPAQYFARPDLVWEALLCIAEPSPVRGRRGLLDRLRLGWETDTLSVPAACRAF